MEKSLDDKTKRLELSPNPTQPALSSFNSRGFSLVEIMVSIGIMSIIGLAMATMMSNQAKDFQASDEKMALQSTQLLITNVLSSPAFCGCFIGTNTFNYTTTTWNGFPTAIGSSYNGACAAVGGALLTVGTAIGSSKLKPTAMNLQNITETMAGSGNFSAELNIQFDQTLLTRSRKPIIIPMYFTVKMTAPEPATARILSSCSSAASGGPAIDPATLCTVTFGGVYNAAAVAPTSPCKMTYQ